MPLICTWRLNYIGPQRGEKKLTPIFVSSVNLKSVHLLGDISYVLLAPSFWDGGQLFLLFLPFPTTHRSIMCSHCFWCRRISIAHAAPVTSTYEREPLRAGEKDMQGAIFWHIAAFGKGSSMEPWGRTGANDHPILSNTKPCWLVFKNQPRPVVTARGFGWSADQSPAIGT